MQPTVGEQGAHWCALQAWAGLAVGPQAAQSPSEAQLAGHLGEQSPLTQVSVDWHWLMSLAVQATHAWAAVSQTWWAGSQSAQSASALQVMVGTPLLVGHEAAPARSCRSSSTSARWDSRSRRRRCRRRSGAARSGRWCGRRCSPRSRRRWRSCGAGRSRWGWPRAAAGARPVPAPVPPPAGARAPAPTRSEWRGPARRRPP